MTDGKLRRISLYISRRKDHIRKIRRQTACSVLLENREEENDQQTGSKNQRNKGTDVGGTGPDVKLHSGARAEKAFAELEAEGAAEAIWQFNKEIVDKTYDLIPAVKPQIAMYEQFGVPGIEAFKKTVDYCKSKDLVVIGDIKRGDIGSTSAAYAVGHLGSVKWEAKSTFHLMRTFATVNPYLALTGESVHRCLQKNTKRSLFL